MQPKINNQVALNRAMSHIGAKTYLWQDPSAAKQMDSYKKPEGELVIIPDFESGRDIADIKTFKLAYKFDIYATKPLSRGNLYIDANTGKALLYDAIIKHVDNFGFKGYVPVTVETEAEFCARTETAEYTAFVSGSTATRYSGTKTIETRLVGSTYALRDNTRGGGINTYSSGGQDAYPQTNFTDANNNWTAAEFNNAAKDNAALDAHWGAEKTYDYWQTVHSRNSYNGNGAAINSYVHYDDIPGGAGYDNAFWNGSVMTYGDGSSNGNEGNGGFDALTSIDVAAHEIGHAVTTFTADLAYQRESGGLNEGFSDIWGAAVEHFAKGNGNDANPNVDMWLIGDEIDRRTGSAALRSMSNPTALGQPDTYGGQYWKNPNCGTPTRNNDYCGVHTNSGVLNYWFYLSVVGGNGTNDVGSAFSVSGIGMNKAAKIAYRTLSQYLSANSTFVNARAGAIQAAKDLYGSGGAEEQAVTNAWHAVGVGAAFAGGGGSSYCASTSTNVNDEYISRVQLNTINKTSTGQFYSDFTNVSTDLTEGTSYTIIVTPTWTGQAYAEGYAVWIDYNGDTDFDDSGELVWSKAASTNTPNSGSFTVPANTSRTATRMRVSMKYNGIPTACESFTYGEVEDYTVNLNNLTADTQAPTAPTSLTASGITNTTVDLSWVASTDNVAIKGYDVYQGNTVLETVTGITAQVTGLTTATAYSFKVLATDAAGNNSAFSNIKNVTTTGGGGGNTGCAGGISSFPYSESFESSLGAWSQSSADDIDWARDASGTPSSGTGPSTGAAGSFYMYVEASGNAYPSKRAILNSPCFNLSSASVAYFNFSYHMYGATDMGSIVVEVSDNNGSSWTNVFSKTGNQGNSWKEENINLSAYAGKSIQIRFNRLTGSTWQADIAVDAISVTTSAPSADPCAGVSPYNSSNSYSIGDRVTYQVNLFERASSNWNNLGPCGAIFNGMVATGNTDGPPVNGTFKIYPNPVKGSILNVDVLDMQPTDYVIYNLVGQVVGKGAYTKTVDVSSLNSGVYIIQINVNGDKLTERFIKE